MRFRELKLRKSPDCPVCGPNRTVTELIDYNQFCGIRGEEAVPSPVSGDMSVEDLKRRLDAGEDWFVLDVREPHEFQICNLGGYLIPLNDLPKRVHELDSSREIVVHCKMGGRSAKAADFLRQAGYSPVEKEDMQVSESMLRLSVGIEDAEDILDDLELALASF